MPYSTDMLLWLMYVKKNPAVHFPLSKKLIMRTLCSGPRLAHQGASGLGKVDQPARAGYGRLWKKAWPS